jgi:hypothetical protein
MNKELLEKLTASSAKLLEFIEKTSETTVDFAKEQVPLVIQEVLAWGFYSNLFYTLLNLVLLIVFSVLYFKLCKWMIRLMDESDGFSTFGILLGTIPISVVCMNLVSYSLLTLKICVAPRLYLIETLQTLLK